MAMVRVVDTRTGTVRQVQPRLVEGLVASGRFRLEAGQVDLVDDVFGCEECGRLFDTERGLAVHVGQMHGDAEEDVSS